MPFGGTPEPDPGAFVSELRVRGEHVRWYAAQLPPDEAVQRLLEFAAELDAQADALEQDNPDA
jgi:hypothetical protein